MIRVAREARQAPRPASRNNEPAYFVTTGFPRSGNTWFETMLSETPDIGGFSPDQDAGVPLTLQMIRRHPRLVRLFESHGMALESVVQRLLNPDDASTSTLPESERAVITRIMAEEVVPDASRVRHYFDESRNGHGLSVARLVEPLFSAGRSSHESPGRIAAFGLPSKHIPVEDLRKATPNFRIIQIMRDPRDVIISKFYLDLGQLRGHLIDRFVSRDGDRRLRLREDWAEAYFKPLRDRMIAYFSGNEAADIEVRYERLLNHTSSELTRVINDLGGRPDVDEIRRIVDHYRFDRVSGSTVERRNSFIRKGVSGDWQGYFDCSLLRVLGDDFVDLVTRLGYEPDGDWSRQLPEQAPGAFDFSRFRIRRSATAEFQSIWMSDPDLQARYPNPFETRDGRGDTFYDWLRRCGREDVAEWFHTADELLELWVVDIDENVYH